MFFDEAAFCADELIVVCEAFATQNTDFVTDTDDSYNPETQPRKVPTQLVYASSQDTMDKLFYRYYKNFAKRMIAGDRDYFVCDMICDVAIQVYMNGKPYKALLTRDKVEAALKSNASKARREYFNVPERDGGVNQIVKWGTVRRNERKYLPQLYWDKQYKYVIAFDPARTMDNSIVSVMRIYNDPENGMCGDIINCVNMVDLANAKKYKMDSNRQIDELRDIILHYNGQNPDYEYIDTLMVDQGAGGGGTSTYADGLLNNWTDKSGTEHRGFIDANHELYEGYDARYPDAVDKLRLISPRKFRSVMFEELIELMNLGVIHFPLEYNGGDYVQVVDGVDKTTGQEILKTHELSLEEQTSWVNIDLMKNEITSMQKTTNPENTNNATSGSAGLMSAGDKAKLDGIAANANNYSHPTSAGNKHIPAGGQSGQILRWSGDGSATWGPDYNTTYSDFKAATASAAGGSGLVPAPAAGKQSQYLRGDGIWATPTNTTYNDATQSTHGLMSTTDKQKLDGFGAASTYALKSDITAMYRYKGSVASTNKLPTSGQTIGDVYDVGNGMNYAWNGSAWDALGEIFTITKITNTEIDTVLAS